MLPSNFLTWTRSHTAWMIVLTGSLLCTAIPFVFLMQSTGSPLPTMLPALETDTLYYLMQVKEVLDGHPMLGNPFIREYADTHFPGLLLPIWIGSLPGLLGIGINGIFAVNVALYGMLTGMLLFLLNGRLDKRHMIAAAFVTVLGVATMHNNLLRPGIMQIIYPAFILLMLALLRVLEHPRDMSSYIFLGLITALSFYLYPFLWMTAFTAFGLLILFAALRKDVAALQLLVATGIVIGFVCIPQILTTVALFHDTMARELNVRVGLTETHVVLPLTLLNMKYIIMTTCMLVIVTCRRKLNAPEQLIALIGAALFIGSISNVVTGKQMDFDTHFWRLSLPWAAAAMMVLLGGVLRSRQTLERVCLGACFALLLMTSINRVFIRANAFAYVQKSAAVAEVVENLREYDALFAFLNGLPREQVLLTTNDVAEYVPLYTSHYLLYQGKAILHSIPDAELYERFLVQFIDRIDREFLVENATVVSGFGPRHAAVYANAYGGDATYLDFSGGDALIEDLLKKYRDIDARYEEYLRRFSMTYVITDTKADDNPRVPKKVRSVYDDGRFTVFALEQ